MSMLKIYVHVVWGVKYRQALLERRMRSVLVKSVHGLLAARGHRPIVTNCEPDHVHTVFRFTAREDFGKMMQAIKGGSSTALNKAFFTKDEPFRWQGGYAGFSVCPSHVKSKAQYVRDQEIIHARRRYEEEYLEMAADHPPLDLDDDIGIPYWVPLVDR